MDTCKFLTATALVAALTIPIITHAALVGRLAATEGGTDYQAYYDTEADLTWLADANAAAGYNGNSYGFMNWSDANSWAANLSINGVTNWRLPEADISCIGWPCSDSELGNFYYNVLGNPSHPFLPATSGPFYNIMSGSSYWTSTEYTSSTIKAWSYKLNGGQNYENKSYSRYAWAVHSGDVSAVPIPAAVWLFGSGLIGLVGFARRKSNA